MLSRLRRAPLSSLLQTALLGLGLALTDSTMAAEPAITPHPAPILVELFTSEGCSSCPPAEAYLGQLSQLPEVLALSFHVDYWDSLGWVDHSASPDFTRRQREYAAQRGYQVYTPQMVIDGAQDAVGSDARHVERIIEARAAAQPSLGVEVSRKGNAVDIALTPLTANDTSLKNASVWLVSFEPKISTPIRAGENSGRTVASYNVVRSLRTLNGWDGSASHLSETLRPQETGPRLAVIVQRRDGTVAGVAATPAALPST